MTVARVLGAAAAAGLVTVACQVPPERMPPPPAGVGDPERGRVAISEQGCGSCHVIPGVRGADGRVGPTLEGVGRRAYIAGRLPNSAENLARWIRDPQAIEPGNAMPTVPMTEDEARDIAAYLLAETWGQPRRR